MYGIRNVSNAFILGIPSVMGWLIFAPGSSLKSKYVVGVLVRTGDYTYRYRYNINFTYSFISDLFIATNWIQWGA